MEDKSGGEVLDPKPTKGKSATLPTFDTRTLLFQASGKDLTLIEGIDQSSASCVDTNSSVSSEAAARNGGRPVTSSYRMAPSA
jgi:hypothetical protein